MSVVIQIVTSLIAVFVGAGVTYFVNVRERRRRYVEDLFNVAISGVTAAQAAMIFPTNVPSEVGLAGQQLLSLTDEIRADGYRQFLTLLAEARRAVAGARPYREELAAFLEPFDAVAFRADEVIAILRRGPSESTSLR